MSVIPTTNVPNRHEKKAASKLFDMLKRTSTFVPPPIEPKAGTKDTKFKSTNEYLIGFSDQSTPLNEIETKASLSVDIGEEQTRESAFKYDETTNRFPNLQSLRVEFQKLLPTMVTNVPPDLVPMEGTNCLNW